MHGTICSVIYSVVSRFERKSDLITPGILAKFTQCPIPKSVLLNTGTRNILEANPNDLFFGVGVSLFSQHLWDKGKHKGLNIMGKVLQKVRSKLCEGGKE